jgi:hypothetical protein
MNYQCEEAKLSTEEIAEIYRNMDTQDRGAAPARPRAEAADLDYHGGHSL